MTLFPDTQISTILLPLKSRRKQPLTSIKLSQVQGKWRPTEQNCIDVMGDHHYFSSYMREEAATLGIFVNISLRLHPQMVQNKNEILCTLKIYINL